MVSQTGDSVPLLSDAESSRKETCLLEKTIPPVGNGGTISQEVSVLCDGGSLSWVDCPSLIFSVPGPASVRNNLVGV